MICKRLIFLPTGNTNKTYFISGAGGRGEISFVSEIKQKVFQQE
jgi:hypothetical protein